MSASKKPSPAKHIEDSLDEALEETFPASDPIAVVPEPPTSAPPQAKDKGSESRRHVKH